MVCILPWNNIRPSILKWNLIILLSILIGKPEYELTQTAWRERNPEARIKAAKEAIAINPECATGYILLSEEESEDIEKAEQKLREAYKIAEANHRRSQQLQHQSPMMESQHRRDTNVMIYIRRRLAMCARKLGRLKEVTRISSYQKAFILCISSTLHE